ncbi:MAG: hypothetical protein RLZZ628_964 [Bacteroidota bacterium]|jgi:hypothetical protein
MNDWTEKIIACWVHEKVRLNLGASREEIHQAEKKLGFLFPKDFKMLYLRVNGLEDWLPNLFTLWSLEQIIAESQICPNPQFIGFSDYSIHCHDIGFLKDQEGIFKYSHAPEKIAETFEIGLTLIQTDSILIY